VPETDVVAPGTFGFVEMAPGWHVTMGPGGLLHNPRLLAQGRFTIESRFALFPGAAPGEYGVFVGGTGLDSNSPAYTAFVVRRDGSAAVLRFQNGRAAMLHPWSASPVVRGGSEGGANVISVAVDSNVVFRVNGETIATLRRSGTPTDGAIGFRIAAGINLHITTLDLLQRIAPAR
jgi:hypothetical protein